MWEVSTYTRGVRVTGLIIPRTGWYLTLGLVFGMLAFMRTNAYRRRTGSSPWHIHPLVWGLVSVFVAFLVTLLSIVFVAIFGTVLSIFAWAPRSQPSREPGATASLVSAIGRCAPQWVFCAGRSAGAAAGPRPGAPAPRGTPKARECAAPRGAGGRC